jgi:DNA-binding NtrC family response regulator
MGVKRSQFHKRHPDVTLAWKHTRIAKRHRAICHPIRNSDFSVDDRWLSQQPGDRGPEGNLRLSEMMAAQEQEIIEEALRECRGRVFGPSGAATKLGIARTTLESKIQSLKINKNRFKA